MIDESKVKRLLVIESILGCEKIFKNLQVTHGGEIAKRKPYGYIYKIPVTKNNQLELWDRIESWLYRQHKDMMHLINIGTSIEDI